MTCTDLTFRTREPSRLGRAAVLAAAGLIGAATAAAVWTSHPTSLGPVTRGPDRGAYVLAKVGAVPFETPRSDIPYGR